MVLLAARSPLSGECSTDGPREPIRPVCSDSSPARSRLLMALPKTLQRRSPVWFRLSRHALSCTTHRGRTLRDDSLLPGSPLRLLWKPILARHFQGIIPVFPDRRGRTYCIWPDHVDDLSKLLSLW